MLNRGQIADGERILGDACHARFHHVFLQTAKQRGKARAATQADHTQWTAGDHLQRCLIDQRIHAKFAF
jgi:hypothetical protein